MLIRNKHCSYFPSRQISTSIWK